jgi:hypothetical protein
MYIYIHLSYPYLRVVNACLRKNTTYFGRNETHILLEVSTILIKSPGFAYAENFSRRRILLLSLSLKISSIAKIKVENRVDNGGSGLTCYVRRGTQEHHGNLREDSGFHGRELKPGPPNH